MEVIFEIIFLVFSKIKVDFIGKQLTWKTYTTAKALPTIKKVQIISLKEFTKTMLDPEQETFVIHVALFFQNQEQKVQIAAFIADKALITILAEYLDFEHIFSKEFAVVLLKHTEINTYAINLEEGKQLPYRPIYSLGLMELETLKADIETKLANVFIHSSKSLIGAPILFDKKPNRNLWLCVNYRGLNNITIKNRYLLTLVGESPDCLGCTK